MPANMLTWTLISIPVIVLAGTLLHFAYAWSGRRRAVAVFAPVNESVWEHLKMAYWPFLLYTGLVSTCLESPKSLVSALALGFVATAALMLGLFYLTVRAAPQPESKGRLIADGTIFVVAVAAGQLLGYVLIGRIDIGAATGLVLLLAPGAVLAVTTFMPPRLSPFRDQLTGNYGVPSTDKA